MDNLLSKIEPGQLIGLVAVGGAMLVAIISVVMRHWVDLRRTTSAAALKQDMLERGMSADDIQTVLDAGTGRKGRASRC